MEKEASYFATDKSFLKELLYFLFSFFFLFFFGSKDFVSYMPQY